MRRGAGGLFFVLPILLLLIFVSQIFSGCACGKFSGPEFLHGLIVNVGDIPVSGYEISVDGETVDVSDDCGLFELRLGRAGEICFTGKKDGWVDFSAVEKNVDPERLYVYRVESLGMACSKIECKILDRDFSEALKEIEGLEKNGGDERMGKFLKCVVAFQEGRYEDAARLYEEAEVDVERNPYMIQFERKIGNALWCQE